VCGDSRGVDESQARAVEMSIEASREVGAPRGVVAMKAALSGDK
jgi:hypothetical protein